MRTLDLLHRWTGGLIGLLLAALGLSGAILVHRNALIFLLHANDAQVQDTAVLARVTQQVMGDAAARPQSLTFAPHDLGLHRLAFPDGSGAYIDQTGAPVAQWANQWERPELWLFDFHHHLFAGETGDTIIGIAAIAGLLFVVTGLILWWRTRKTFQPRLLPARLSRPAVVRHHRDLGVVVTPLLLISLITGAVLVFRPLAALILGPGAPAQIDRALAGPPPRKARLSEDLNWSAMVETGRARFPDAEVRSLSLPRGDNGLITLRMRRPEEWLPNGRTTLWFAADTGALVASRDARSLSLPVRAYNLLYPLHAAKVGGLPYKLAMTISGLSLGLLGTLAVWTFWFKRARSRKRAAQHGGTRDLAV